MMGAMHVHAVRLKREMFDTLLLEPGKCPARGAVATYRGKAWRATGARARPRRAVVMLTGDEAARGRAHAPAGHAVGRTAGRAAGRRRARGWLVLTQPDRDRGVSTTRSRALRRQARPGGNGRERDRDTRGDE